jgi:hypothetical protein
VGDGPGGLEFKRGDTVCRLHCSILAQSQRSACGDLTGSRRLSVHGADH